MVASLRYHRSPLPFRKDIAADQGREPSFHLDLEPLVGSTRVALEERKSEKTLPLSMPLARYLVERGNRN